MSYFYMVCKRDFFAKMIRENIALHQRLVFLVDKIFSHEDKLLIIYSKNVNSVLAPFVFSSLNKDNSHYENYCLRGVNMDYGYLETDPWNPKFDTDNVDYHFATRHPKFTFTPAGKELSINIFL